MKRTCPEKCPLTEQEWLQLRSDIDGQARLALEGEQAQTAMIEAVNRVMHSIAARTRAIQRIETVLAKLSMEEQ
jgi:hypothetical protein